MERKYLWLLVVVVLIGAAIPGVGFWIYATTFSGRKSISSSDWSNFATFHGYFISVANMIFVGIIGFVTYRTTHEYNLTQLRPLIICTIENPEFIKGRFPDSWYIINGANSPASNVLVRFSFEAEGNDNYSKWVACYPMSSESKRELPWLHYATRIQVCYSNITERKYFIYTFQDLEGETNPMGQTAFRSAMLEARANRDNNTTNLRDTFKQYLDRGGSIESGPYMTFIEQRIF